MHKSVHQIQVEGNNKHVYKMHDDVKEYTVKLEMKMPYTGALPLK